MPAASIFDNPALSHGSRRGCGEGICLAGAGFLRERVAATRVARRAAIAWALHLGCVRVLCSRMPCRKSCAKLPSVGIRDHHFFAPSTPRQGISGAVRPLSRKTLAPPLRTTPARSARLSRGHCMGTLVWIGRCCKYRYGRNSVTLAREGKRGGNALLRRGGIVRQETRIAFRGGATYLPIGAHNVRRSGFERNRSWSTSA